MNAHTPGPWWYQISNGHVSIMTGPTIDAILAITTTSNDVGRANARLIAAAPELAAALRRLVVDVETIVANHAVHPPAAALDALAAGPDSPLRGAMRALAKAGGGGPAEAPDPVATLRRVLRWYRETTDGEMPPEIYDAACRAVGEGVGE